MARTTEAWASAVGEAADGGAGEDGEEQVAAAQVAAYLGHDGGQHLGLDGQDDDLPLFGGHLVVGGAAHAVAVAQLLGALRAGAGGDDLRAGRRPAG
jgi:hypothetical protein